MYPFCQEALGMVQEEDQYGYEIRIIYLVFAHRFEPYKPIKRKESPRLIIIVIIKRKIGADSGRNEGELEEDTS